MRKRGSSFEASLWNETSFDDCVIWISISYTCYSFIRWILTTVAAISDPKAKPCTLSENELTSPDVMTQEEWNEYDEYFRINVEDSCSICVYSATSVNKTKKRYYGNRCNHSLAHNSFVRYIENRHNESTKKAIEHESVKYNRLMKLQYTVSKRILYSYQEQVY